MSAKTVDSIAASPALPKYRSVIYDEIGTPFSVRRRLVDVDSLELLVEVVDMQAHHFAGEKIQVRFLSDFTLEHPA
jgi:hypothetical protein